MCLFAPGIAVDNLGNFQQISPSLAAAMEAGNQLGQSRLMPAIIQVPGVQTTNGMPAILVSSQPTTGILTLPRGATTQQVAASRSQNVMIRPSVKVQRLASKVSAQRAGETTASGNPIHVVLVQQGEKNRKSTVSSACTVNNSRQRFAAGIIGKRPINRFGVYRGKHFLPRLTDSRARLHNGRPLMMAPMTTTTVAPQQQSQQEQTVADQGPIIFKQEINNEMEQSSLFAGQALSSSVVNEMEQTSSLFASQTVRVSGESSLFIPQRMSPQMVTAEQQQPMFTTTSNNMVNMSLVPESLQVDTGLSTELMQPTQPHSGSSLQSPRSGDILSSIDTQGLSSPSDLFQQQQVQMSQMQQAQLQLQNHISQTNLLDMPTAESLAQDMVQAQIQQEQQQQQLCQQQQQAELMQEASNIHQVINSGCQTLVVKQLADEGLCSPLASTELVQSHLLAPPLQPSDLLSPSTFDRPPLELPLPQESLSPGRVEPTLLHGANLMQENILMPAPDSSVPTSLSLVKPELFATTSPTATPLTSQLNICVSNSALDGALPSPFSNRLVESQPTTCLQHSPSSLKEVQLQSTTPDFPPQEQSMIDHIKTMPSPQQEPALMASPSTPCLQEQNIMGTVTTSMSLSQHEASVIPSTSTLSLHLQSSLVSTSNSLLCQQSVNPITTSLPPTVLQTGPLPTTQSQPQQLPDGTTPPTTTAPPLSSYQTSMTLALSQLSEADLLSLINPSTFDNLY